MSPMTCTCGIEYMDKIELFTCLRKHAMKRLTEGGNTGYLTDRLIEDSFFQKNFDDFHKVFLSNLGIPIIDQTVEYLKFYSQVFFDAGRLAFSVTEHQKKNTDGR